MPQLRPGAALNKQVFLKKKKEEKREKETRKEQREEGQGRAKTGKSTDSHTPAPGADTGALGAKYLLPTEAATDPHCWASEGFQPAAPQPSPD